LELVHSGLYFLVERQDFPCIVHVYYGEAVKLRFYTI